MVDIEAGTVELCIPNYRPINRAGYRRLNLQVFRFSIAVMLYQTASFPKGVVRRQPKDSMDMYDLQHA